MVKVFIYAEDVASIQDQCRGSSSNGGCPGSQPGAAVVCAGRKIVLAARGGIPAFALFVEPDACACPLAALNLFGDDLPAVASLGRVAAASRPVADELPAASPLAGAAGVLRGARQRGERAAARLIGWGRAVRAALATAGRTIQPLEGGD
ncbi:MAG: hypothetical protein IIA23_00025 [Chloroflexi bacterium]|nr:hypothetical protein [Chloroflexota bacterium]